MIQDLTSLCVAPDQVDEDVGEDGEEDEDKELCHRDDCKQELGDFARSIPEFCSYQIVFNTLDWIL